MAVRDRADEEGRGVLSHGRDCGVGIDDIRDVDHSHAVGAVGAVKHQRLERAPLLPLGFDIRP